MVSTEPVPSQDFIADLIRGVFDQLTPKQQHLARFVTDNLAFCTSATAEELARRVGVDAATVVRFTQALGFRGYKDFRQNLRHGWLRTADPMEVFDSHTRSALASPGQTSILADLTNLKHTLESYDEAAIQAAAATIIRARRTLVVTTGSYAALGMILAHFCNFLGFDVQVENRGSVYLANNLAALGPDDLVIGIGFWRVTRDAVAAVQWARGRGIPTLAVTDSNFSPLARSANQVLLVCSEGASFFQSMVCPLSVLYAVISTMAVHGGDACRETMLRAEELYKQLGLVDPLPGGPTWPGTG